jgi:hypothetical protein
MIGWPNGLKKFMRVLLSHDLDATKLLNKERGMADRGQYRKAVDLFAANRQRI